MSASRFAALSALISVGLVACGACGACGKSSESASVTVEAGAGIDGSITVTSGGDGGSSDSGSDATMPGPACGSPSFVTGFTTGHTVKWGTSGTGTYSLYLSPSYDGHTVMPAIFAFHGDGGDGASMRAAGLEQASGGAAIIVYPNGPNQTWDLDDLPPNNPDYLFYEAMVADIKTSLCTDPNSIFAFGFSRGAFFVNQLGCFESDYVKAITANSGGGPYDNNSSDFDNNGVFICPKPPVAALIIHGTADTSIQTGVPYTAGETSRDHWVIRNGCQMTTTPWDPSPCVEYNGCPPQHEVVWCSIDGMGHQIWGSAAVAAWKFFTTL